MTYEQETALEGLEIMRRATAHYIRQWQRGDLTKGRMLDLLREREEHLHGCTVVLTGDALTRSVEISRKIRDMIQTVETRNDNR